MIAQRFAPGMQVWAAAAAEHLFTRREILATPQGEITYIAAIMDLTAETNESHRWKVRDQPGVLTYAFHARTLLEWTRTVRQKPHNELFQLLSGMMSGWVSDNLGYLQAAVGSEY